MSDHQLSTTKFPVSTQNVAVASPTSMFVAPQKFVGEKPHVAKESPNVSSATQNIVMAPPNAVGCDVTPQYLLLHF